MKAYVLEEVGQLKYKEIPTPKLQEDEVLVEVVNAGICGSDIPRIFKTGTYHFPTIPGHEFAGVVNSVGSGQNKDLIGKRVGVFPLIPCMKCEQCKKKMYEMCMSYNYLGSRTDGGFAEYVAVPAWNLIELPDAVSFEDAAMLEPTAVALHAIRQTVRQKDFHADRHAFTQPGLYASVEPDSHAISQPGNLPDLSGVTAAVYGCGTIGMLVIQWLSAMGVKELYAIGTRKEQEDLLAKLHGLSVKSPGAGAEPNYFFCNCREESPIEFIKNHTAGRDVDIVFECVGISETINNAVNSARAGGQVVFVGNPAGNIELGKRIYWDILRRQLTIQGTWNSSFTKEDDDDWHVALKAIQEGKIKPSGQITQRFAFDSLQKGLQVMQDKSVFSNKVMICM